MSGAEQRTTPRYRIEPGSFAYYALGTGVIRDLSLGGVFIEDRLDPFSEGIELDIELHLDEEVISLRGTVCRSQPKTGFAVQFHEFPAETKRRLEAYFRAHFGSA